MNEQTDERQASAGQVERPVRPSLSEALDAWWDAAYVEGRDGRTHDTEGGAAQQALQDIWAAHQAALVAAVAAAVAAERERCARICDVTPPHPFRPSIEAAHAIRNQKA